MPVDSKADTRPNILFVMADQMSAMALPFHGHPVVKTPTLSRLAAEGVLCDQAYTNFPLCAPARYSLMAGQLASRIGAFDNAAEFPASIPTFAHYLRKLGYQACLSGKMHFAGPDQLHGFEKRLTTDIYPADFGWTANWRAAAADQSFQDMANMLSAGVCVRSLQLDYDEETATRGIQQIYDYARQPDGQPFFLTVSFTHPHDPYHQTAEYWDLYRDEAIDLPAVAPIPVDQKDPHSRRIYYHHHMDEVTPSEAQIRRARHGYYASISYIDAKVKALLDCLEASGLADNTIVVFTADHGDMMGERGLWYKKSFYEWAIRVPMIFWAPGLVKRGLMKPGRIAQPTSLVDLLPTFIELAGGSLDELVEPVDGHSLAGPIAGQASLPERSIAAEFLCEGVHDPVFMLRRGRFKMMHSEIDPPLLYDLETDPLELNNLAGDPAHADLLATFQSEARGLWDTEALKARILLDQDRRRLVYDVGRTGQLTVWDYEPRNDASQQFIRAGAWTSVVEPKSFLGPPKG